MEKVKTNIYLLRHGEKNSNGSGLSRDGIKQSRYLARRLKKIKFDGIYSSELARCKQTVEILNKLHKKKIVFTDLINEVKGEVKDFPEKHKTEIKKIKSFWEEITKQEGTILIVGSGTVNRILISFAMGISPKNSRFVQIPTGLTHLEFINKNKTRFVYVNDLSHLPKHLKKRQAY
jgi:broad specificity phosphatase PhoE